MNNLNNFRELSTEDKVVMESKGQAVVYTTKKLGYSRRIQVQSVAIGICFTLYFYFGSANLILGYDAQHFHLWQLITAHFMHYNLEHLSFNMLALVILLYLFPSPLKVFLKACVLAIIFIDLYLLFSDVRFYLGFSGLLYVILGLALARNVSMKNYLLSFIIFVSFVIYTMASKAKILEGSGIIWHSLYQAHFFGFVSGFMMFGKINKEY